MEQEGFLALCRATSIALGSKDADALGNTHAIDIDGVHMALFFDEDFAPDRILCYIDIGHLPRTGREEIMARILALNLLTATKTAGVYGLDQGTDSLIFVQHFIFPELLDGAEFAAILQGYSAHANSLKQNLLDPANLRPVPDMLAESFSSSLQKLA